MKKLFIAIAAIVCCAFTSCVNNDNPVETVEDNIPLADAIKLHTAPQSFHKLDTDEVQPIYVVWKISPRDYLNLIQVLLI